MCSTPGLEQRDLPENRILSRDTTDMCIVHKQTGIVHHAQQPKLTSRLHFPCSTDREKNKGRVADGRMITLSFASMSCNNNVSRERTPEDLSVFSFKNETYEKKTFGSFAAKFILQSC